MPSSWDVYYVVFLSALLALGIPALLGAVSYLVAEKNKRQGITSTRVNDRPNAGLLSKKINARFFLGVNAALVLMALSLVLIPCAGMLQQSGDRASYLKGLVAVISIAGFCSLGLLYSSRKGDLSWVRSFQQNKNPENP